MITMCLISFQIGVKISLSSSGLTKIVVFTPYYMLANHAKVGHDLDTQGQGQMDNAIAPID